MKSSKYTPDLISQKIFTNSFVITDAALCDNITLAEATVNQIIKNWSPKLSLKISNTSGQLNVSLVYMTGSPFVSISVPKEESLCRAIYLCATNAKEKINFTLTHLDQ